MENIKKLCLSILCIATVARGMHNQQPPPTVYEYFMHEYFRQFSSQIRPSNFKKAVRSVTWSVLPTLVATSNSTTNNNTISGTSAAAPPFIFPLAIGIAVTIGVFGLYVIGDAYKSKVMSACQK
jgi:hypothetical protein